METTQDCLFDDDVVDVVDASPIDGISDDAFNDALDDAVVVPTMGTLSGVTMHTASLALRLVPARKES